MDGKGDGEACISLCLRGGHLPLHALTGSGLLTQANGLEDAFKSDLVRAAGYVSTKKVGSEWLKFTAFDAVLLEAKGVSLGDGGGNGNLLVVCTNYPTRTLAA